MRNLVKVLWLVALVGCGEVSEAMSVDATGEAGEGGTAGTTGGAGTTGTAGTLGTAGTTGAGGTGGGPCVERSRQECRDAGEVVLGGSFICRDDGSADPTWGMCTDGKLTGTEYSGLACPFNVAAEYDETMTSCPEAIGWRGQAGAGVTWCSWRDTTDTIYCCAGTAVRKIGRCK